MQLSPSKKIGAPKKRKRKKEKKKREKKKENMKKEKKRKKKQEKSFKKWKNGKKEKGRTNIFLKKGGCRDDKPPKNMHFGPENSGEAIECVVFLVSKVLFLDCSLGNKGGRLVKAASFLPRAKATLFSECGLFPKGKRRSHKRETCEGLNLRKLQ